MGDVNNIFHLNIKDLLWLVVLAVVLGLCNYGWTVGGVLVSCFILMGMLLFLWFMCYLVDKIIN